MATTREKMRDAERASKKSIDALQKALDRKMTDAEKDIFSAGFWAGISEGAKFWGA